MSKLRAFSVILVSIWPSYLLAQSPTQLLRNMAGTWDVQQRIWPGPKADPANLPAAVAKRRLVRDTYLEEVMEPAHSPEPQSAAFSRHALINYNPVTSRYEYTSIDTRATQVMFEQSERVTGTVAEELQLQGGSFLAPEWGNAKNVRFRYRLTIGPIKQDKQIVRLFLTPETVMPRNEFLAFEYVYSRRP